MPVVLPQDQGIKSGMLSSLVTSLDFVFSFCLINYNNILHQVRCCLVIVTSYFNEVSSLCYLSNSRLPGEYSCAQSATITISLIGSPYPYTAPSTTFHLCPIGQSTVFQCVCVCWSSARTWPCCSVLPHLAGTARISRGGMEAPASTTVVCHAE